MTTGLSRNQIQICRAFGIIFVALHHAINNMSNLAGGRLAFRSSPLRCDILLFYFGISIRKE